MAKNKKHFSAPNVSACSYPAELLCVIQRLLHHSPKYLKPDHMSALCDQLADKITQICSWFDASIDVSPDYVPLASVCLIYIHIFQLVNPEDVDRWDLPLCSQLLPFLANKSCEKRVE